MDGMCEVLLVRHGEQHLRENIPLGESVDPPLSELGEQQAAAVGERLAPVPLDAVFSSSLRRAMKTAGEISRHHSLEPSIVAGIEEIELWKHAPQDKGLLDIYDRQELTAIYRGVNASRMNSSWPFCEDPVAFKSRVVNSIDGLIEQNLGRRIAVACHGGVINAYLSHLTGSPYDNLVTVHHTSITTVRGADTRRALLTINDYSHVMDFQTKRGDMNA